MSSLRDAPGRPGAGASTSGPELRQSLLLPLLFERLDESEPFTVLDVGPGVGETVEFFARYRCRLHFADLFDAPELEDRPEEEAEAHFEAVFEKLLAFPVTTRFDVCLLWDFLNYLPVPALRAFSTVLSPYLHRHSVGHGFGAFKATAPGMSWAAPEAGLAYGIRDVDSLVVRPRSSAGGAVAAYPHSRTVLAESFRCFEVVRGTLLQEGAMELLFKAR